MPNQEKYTITHIAFALNYGRDLQNSSLPRAIWKAAADLSYHTPSYPIGYIETERSFLHCGLGSARVLLWTRLPSNDALIPTVGLFTRRKRVCATVCSG
jgi:hypothetical protein